MRLRAYNELYLSDAQRMLASAFDYALNVCNLDATWFGTVFGRSHIGIEIERGNPTYISGKAGEEVVRELLQSIMPGEEFPSASFNQDRSPAYWAGWALAYYQWFTAKRFKDIFIRVPLSEILSMYKLYHEMDLTNFVEDLDARYGSVVLETKLKKIRESRGLSQSKLAELSGATKRSIQLYEQKVNDIDKAQGQTLYKLSRVLGCTIEDLLENPESL